MNITVADTIDEQVNHHAVLIRRSYHGCPFGDYCITEDFRTDLAIDSNNDIGRMVRAALPDDVNERVVIDCEMACFYAYGSEADMREVLRALLIWKNEIADTEVAVITDRATKFIIGLIEEGFDRDAITTALRSLI